LTRTTLSDALMPTLWPPPHTAASLKRCISNAERFAYLGDKLFLNISSESPMDDKLSISILTNKGPGATASKPMALVRPAFNQRVQVKRQHICECTMEWSFEYIGPYCHYSNKRSILVSRGKRNTQYPRPSPNNFLVYW
jgi:hypothetical protein